MELSWRQCLAWFAGNRAVPLLGIDISPAGIRIIELSQLRDGWRVEHFCRRALPHGAIREGSIVNPDQVAEALADAIRECGSRLRHAALALPSGLVIRKILNLPDDLSDDELELQVEADAAQSLPFALDELSLDFGVIGPSAAAPESMEVLLVAARREKIDERLSLVKAAGIRPLIVDVESQAFIAAMALQQAADQEQPQGSSALLHVGRDTSQFTVFNRELVVFERELAVGLHKFEQEVSRHPEQANAALDAFHAVICQEIRRAQQLYATTAEHEEIARLVLAGPAEKLSRLPAAIMEKLGLSSLLANPFKGMTCSPAVDQGVLHADASACLVACGLAMRFAQP